MKKSVIIIFELICCFAISFGVKNIFPAGVKEIVINNYNTINLEPIKTILFSDEEIYNFIKLLNSTYLEEADIPRL